MPHLLGQLELTVNPQTLVVVYGPLGVAVWWLSRLVYKLLADNRKSQEAFLDAVKDNTHKLSGMSMALIMNAATYGPENIRALAQKELEKRGKMPDTWDRMGPKNNK